MRNVALDMAALNGKTITQAHTDYCLEHGHATYRLGGVVQDRCPRCDALTTIPRVYAFNPATVNFDNSDGIDWTVPDDVTGAMNEMNMCPGEFADAYPHLIVFFQD